MKNKRRQNVRSSTHLRLKNSRLCSHSDCCKCSFEKFITSIRENNHSKNVAYYSTIPYYLDPVSGWECRETGIKGATSVPA